MEIAFNALHGKFGEDGAIQGMLEIMGIPCTGSGILASAMGMNKIISKTLFKAYGLQVGPFLSVSRGDSNMLKTANPRSASARGEAQLRRVQRGREPGPCAERF